MDYLSKEKRLDYNEKPLNWKDKKYDEKEIIEKIKEKLSYASLNYESDILPEKKYDVEESCFELPDKTIIKLDNITKFKSAEVLLRPSIWDPK